MDGQSVTSGMTGAAAGGLTFRLRGSGMLLWDGGRPLAPAACVFTFGAT